MKFKWTLRLMIPLMLGSTVQASNIGRAQLIGAVKSFDKDNVILTNEKGDYTLTRDSFARDADFQKGKILTVYLTFAAFQKLKPTMH